MFETSQLLSATNKGNNGQYTETRPHYELMLTGDRDDDISMTENSASIIQSENEATILGDIAQMLNRSAPALFLLLMIAIVILIIIK